MILSSGSDIARGWGVMQSSSDEEYPVSIKDGAFHWDKTPTLKDINMRVKKGSLVAIVRTPRWWGRVPARV